MKKIWDWLNESNRLMHLIGGAMVGGLLGGIVDLYGEWWLALLVGVITAAAVGGGMEFKDRQWGGKFDWIDLAMTALGGLIGSAFIIGYVAALNLFK